MTIDSVAAPPPPPQYSADGQWWWTGAEWIDSASKAERDSVRRQMPAPSAVIPLRTYPAPVPTTNGLAVASLVLGIVWLSGLGSLLAVIFGHVASRQIRRTGQRGKGLATAGLILGYLGLAVIATAAIVIALSAHTSQTQRTAGDDASVRSDLRNAANAEESYLIDHSAYVASRPALAAAPYGFVASTGNSMVVGVDGSKGYCIVGTHSGSQSWYLYDSMRGGENTTPFGSLADAETGCSDQAAWMYVTLAGDGS
jgi:hypothetical protein